MNTIPLGSTVSVKHGTAVDTGVLVRRDARNPALPAMLTVQTTSLADRSSGHSLQFEAGDGIEIVAIPAHPGRHVVISTDLTVLRVYYVDDSETDVRAWLDATRPIWYTSGDYAIVAADDPVLLAN